MEINTTGMVGKRRAARFEARGWQQIGQGDWETETKPVTDEVAALLAESYRKILAA